MQVIESIWFTNLQGTVGIVVGEDEFTGERKAYLGIGYGDNESEDVHMIETQGIKLSLSVLDHVRELLGK